MEEQAARPLADLRSVLIPGESLQAWALPWRLFAFTHRSLLIAATRGLPAVFARKLEEPRARSGGIQVLSAAAAPAAGAEGDAVRRLREAKQLLDAKLITDAEYEAIKAKIVSS